MEPSLHPGERVLVRRTSAGRVRRGQIVVLLGDNTASSFDSRRAGYFAADTLLGVVVRSMHG